MTKFHRFKCRSLVYEPEQSVFAADPNDELLLLIYFVLYHILG